LKGSTTGGAVVVGFCPVVLVILMLEAADDELS
jgi:hypothetical protein